MTTDSDAELVQLTEGVYAFIGAGGDSNAGAIRAPGGWIVLDAQQRIGRLQGQGAPALVERVAQARDRAHEQRRLGAPEGQRHVLTDLDGAPGRAPARVEGHLADADHVDVILAEVHLGLGDLASAGVHAKAAEAQLDTLGDAGILEPRLHVVRGALEQRAVDSPAPRPSSDALTTRELQILQLMPSRKSLREIADELFVSRNTAKTHASRIYKKLGVSSREAAVTRAIELQLI